MIGKLNRRPVFQNETFFQDAGGGTQTSGILPWYAWAEIQDRSGSSFNTQSQDVQQYDYKVRVRYDVRFSSNTTMIYEGQTCKCESMVVEKEGYKHFLLLYYKKIETWPA